MKLSLIEKISIPFVLISLVLFEFFVFTIFGRDIFGLSFSNDILIYIFISNIGLVFSLFFIFFKIGIFEKKGIYKTILPILIIISTFAFLFFSPNFIFSQVAIIVSLISFYTLVVNIKNQNKIIFIDLISFFTILLFYFYAYSAITYLVFSYIFILFLVIAFSVLILYYKIKNIEMRERYRRIFIFTFAIIVTEFFLLFFFVPVKSIFIKSLFLVLVYYFYWGILDLYIKESFRKKKIVTFFVVFFVLFLLSLIYSALKIN